MGPWSILAVCWAVAMGALEAETKVSVSRHADLLAKSKEYQARRWRKEAEAEVKEYCVRHPFLTCRTDGLSYLVHSGRYGAGVEADLLTDETNGIAIFFGCETEPTKRQPPDLSTCRRVSARKQISLPVFVKIAQRTFSNIREKTATLWIREIANTRRMSRIKFGKHRLTPVLFDIVDLQTGRPHRIHDRALVQALVEGRRPDQVLSQIFRMENALVERFLRTLNRNDGPEFVERKTDLLLHDLWRAFGLRMSLLDCVVTTTIELWRSGICHCDLHSGNIMMQFADTTDEIDLQVLTHTGRSVFIDGRDLSWDSHDYSAHPPPPSRAVSLEWDAVKFLDLAFSFDVKACMINEGYDEADALAQALQVQRPCRTRGRKVAEDLAKICSSFFHPSPRKAKRPMTWWTALRQSDLVQSYSALREGKIVQLRLDAAVRNMQDVLRALQKKVSNIRQVADCVKVPESTPSVQGHALPSCNLAEMIQGGLEIRRKIRETCEQLIPVPVRLQDGPSTPLS